MTLAACPEVSAVERVHRRFDQAEGLPVGEVYSLAQDPAGFLWIGTFGGLVRYDGAEMRLWGRETINTKIQFIRPSPGGELFVGDDNGLFRVVPDGLQPVIGPDGAPLTKVHDANFDSEGRLWVLRGQQLIRRDQDAWEVPRLPDLAAERIEQLRRGPKGELFVLTRRSVWEVDASGQTRRLFALEDPSELLPLPDGSLITFSAPSRHGGIFEFRDGRLTRRLSLPTRPIELALRGRVIWASFDKYLMALRPEEPPEILGAAQGLPSGGPLLVDKEGSLWLGTFRGLIHYPEPETRAWNELDGLPQTHTRFLARTDEGLWVSTWGWGLGRLANDAGAWRAEPVPGSWNGSLCVDGLGQLWLGQERALVVRRQRKFIRHRWAEFAGLNGCLVAADGTVWLASRTGLFRATPGNLSDRTPLARRMEPGDGTFLKGPGEPRMLQDTLGRFWIADGNRVCQARVADLGAGGLVRWTCQTIPGVVHITGLVQLSDNRFWLSTSYAGLFRREGETWRAMPASRSLLSANVGGLKPSPSGGLWILSAGMPMRVSDRPESEAEFQVLERLSRWHGLPDGGVNDLLEEADGTLWLATLAGVVRVPPEARRAAMPPPPMQLVDTLIDGKRVSLDQLPRLRYKRNLIELRFGALSYRDRRSLRYQIRLRSDAAWTDLSGGEPILRLADLSSGQYLAEVRASLDGRNWTPKPARFAFEVLRPWYLQAWALLLFGLTLASVLYAAHRARVAFLLRLQQQRTRIAMDLHDEVGSGLGSVGILAGLAADGGLDETKRRAVAEEIADTAAELGSTLGDIVWSLRGESTTLQSLAYHLVERAGRLFPGGMPTFAPAFPERWPDIPLSLAARRNLLLIALEALHNAARHAQASRVVLGFAPSGRKWRLWVSDDGVGLPENPRRPELGGMGMSSMRQRAKAIGADLTFSGGSAQGATVSLVFDPQARERDVGRHRPSPQTA